MVQLVACRDSFCAYFVLVGSLTNSTLTLYASLMIQLVVKMRWLYQISFFAIW